MESVSMLPAGREIVLRPPQSSPAGSGPKSKDAAGPFSLTLRMTIVLTLLVKVQLACSPGSSS